MQDGPAYRVFFVIRPVSSAGNQHRISIVSSAGTRYSSIMCYSAGSATYQIWFRLPIPNPNPKPNLNPNPKTDPNPNPKSNNNVCSTNWHWNKVQHSVIYKSYFRWAGGGYTKAYPSNAYHQIISMIS